MALNNLGLGLLFEAKDLASGVIDQVKNKFSQLEDVTEEAKGKFTAGLAEFATGAAMFGAGVATLKMGYGLAEAAAEGEATLAQVGWRTQATAEDMDKLEAAATKAATTMKKFTDDDAKNALLALATGGRNADDAIAMLTPSLRFAGVAGVGAAQSAKLLNETMRAYQLPVSAAGETTERLAWAMRQFGMTGDEVGPTMNMLASSAKLAGASFKDTLMLFGLARSSGQTARMALMSTRSAMMQLADKDVQKKIEKGFSGVKTTADGELRPVVDILADIAAAAQKMPAGKVADKLKEAFGGRAAGGMASIMDALTKGIRTTSGEMLTGAAALEYLSSSYENADGTIQDFADRTGGTMAAMEQKAKAAFDGMKDALGESFLPIFTKAFEAVGNAVRWLTSKFAALPAPAKELIGVFVLAMGALLTFGGVVKMAHGLLTALTAGFKVLGISAATSLAPILLWTAAIAAVIAIGYLVVKNWTVVKKFFVDLWASIVNGVLTAWDKVKAAFSSAGEAVWGALSAAGNAVLDFFINLVDSTIETLMELLDTVVVLFTEDIPSALWAGLQDVGRFFLDIATEVGSFFTETVPEKLAAAVSAIGDFFLEIGRKVWEFFSETIPNAVAAAATSVKNFFLDIPVLGTALKGVGSALDWLGGGMASVVDEAGRMAGAPQVAYATPGAGPQAAPWAPNPGGMGQQPEEGVARPAVAYAAARSESQRLGTPPPRPSRRAAGAPITVPVTLNVDGEQVGQVVARTQRDALARAFEEPEEET